MNDIAALVPGLNRQFILQQAIRLTQIIIVGFMWSSGLSSAGKEVWNHPEDKDTSSTPICLIQVQVEVNKIGTQMHRPFAVYST